MPSNEAVRNANHVRGRGSRYFALHGGECLSGLTKCIFELSIARFQLRYSPWIRVVDVLLNGVLKGWHSIRFFICDIPSVLPI